MTLANSLASTTHRALPALLLLACGSGGSASDTSGPSGDAGASSDGSVASTDATASAPAPVCDTHPWPMEGQCAGRRMRTPSRLPTTLARKWSRQTQVDHVLGWWSGVVDEAGRLYAPSAESGGATTLLRFDAAGGEPTVLYRYETSSLGTWTTTFPLAFRSAGTLLTADGDRIVELDVSGAGTANVKAHYDGAGKALDRLRVDASGVIYAGHASVSMGPVFDGIISRIDAPKVTWSFPWTEHPLHDFVVTGGAIYADEGLTLQRDGSRTGTSGATVMRYLAEEQGTVYGAEVDTVSREVKGLLGLDAATGAVKWRQPPPSIVHVELLRVGVVNASSVHVQFGDKILLGVGAAGLGAASIALGDANPPSGNAFFVDRDGAIAYARTDLLRIYDASGAERARFDPMTLSLAGPAAIRQIFPGKDGTLYALVDESSKGKLVRSTVVALGD